VLLSTPKPLIVFAKFKIPHQTSGEGGGVYANARRTKKIRDKAQGTVIMGGTLVGNL